MMIFSGGPDRSGFCSQPPFGSATEKADAAPGPLQPLPLPKSVTLPLAADQGGKETRGDQILHV